MADIRNISDGLDLNPIEERLNKAIPGPYFSVIGFDDGLNVYVKDGNDGHIADEEQSEIFTHSWQDLKDLIAEVKRLQNVEEELRDRIDQMEYTCEH